MLAASCASDMSEQMFYNRLTFPVIATPKLDGIRCSTLDLPRPPDQKSEAVCRSLKNVPNDYVRHQITKHCPPGLDGEIMTYYEDLLTPEQMRPFNSIQSDVMTIKGQPIFKYHVFDLMNPTPDNGYRDFTQYRTRLEQLKALMPQLPSFVVYVQETKINTLDELLKYEAETVAAGYEGICFRIPSSPYKWGRSTLREGWLVKMKRFVTSEAEIIGMDEEMANNNPMSQNELGYAERSSHKANLSGKGRMGALVCRNAAGVFRIGTGFTADQRYNMWLCKETIVGCKIATYKHQPHGAKELPRIPVFKGFRNPIDL
jgi:DNA ligase 1